MRARIAKLQDGGSVDEATTDRYRQRFIETLGNDLNTSLGITLLYDVLKDDRLDDAAKLFLVRDFDRVLSLDLCMGRDSMKGPDAGFESWISDKVSERLEARKCGDYELADGIRDELRARGIVLKDKEEGTEWELAENNLPIISKSSNYSVLQIHEQG